MPEMTKKIMQDISDIKVHLARLDQKLTDQLPAVDKIIENHQDRLNDHSKRIGVLEKWQYKAIGITVGAMAIFTMIIHLVG